MKTKTTSISYRHTGLFSNLVNDYIELKSEALPFTQYAPTIEGYQNALKQRASFPTDRKVLVEVLQQQYNDLEKFVSPFPALNNKAFFKPVLKNVSLLLDENTFSVTTAHQPNIFTGPLYFFYKIIHAIQLAAELKKKFPTYNFVPVYYMGSEDADLQEVGSYYLGGNSYQWNTSQTGAIGRMKIDDEFIKLIQNLEGYWSVKPMGEEALEVLKQAYQKGKTIAEATLAMVHAYFGKYGLVILQPDNSKLKSLFVEVMLKELKEGFSQKAIQSTKEKLAKNYHIQTEGRALNLFYLKDNLRNRIEKQGANYIVVDTNFCFTEKEIIEELKSHPERFSPNVILRGVYQETLLPGIAFIGGGGELAYWMQLKNVFNEVKVHYPILQLRNSFMFINEKQNSQWKELGFSYEDIFTPLIDLELQYIKSHSKDNLTLTSHIQSLKKLYELVGKEAVKIDATLEEHTKNLSVQAQKKLTALEKKMIRAEKRKQKTSLDRIKNIKDSLFPKESLQERIEHFSEWVGMYGWDWVEVIMKNSKTLESQFTIITIEKNK